jgi:hypothetical protein
MCEDSNTERTENSGMLKYTKGNPPQKGIQEPRSIRKLKYIIPYMSRKKLPQT